MRLIVIGGSQGIGFEVTRAALDAQHDVTVFARTPEKIRLQESNLHLVKGDIRDSACVRSAVAGQEAIVVCIGTALTRKPVTVFSEGTRIVIEAIHPQANPQLIVVTGLGAGDSAGHGGIIYDGLIKPLLLQSIYDDKNRQEAIVRKSRLPWMIVRPGFLTNGSRTGKYRVINDLAGVKAGRISRADVADFILGQLHTPTQFGKTPLLTN